MARDAGETAAMKITVEKEKISQYRRETEKPSTRLRNDPPPHQKKRKRDSFHDGNINKSKRLPDVVANEDTDLSDDEYG